VSDIVTSDLPYQAKAGRNLVPKLLKTSQDLDDEHPIRLQNRPRSSTTRKNATTRTLGSSSRSGNDFWMPLRINPEQEDLWHDLVSEDAKAGEIRFNSIGRIGYYTSPSSTRLKNQRRTVTPRTSS